MKLFGLRRIEIASLVLFLLLAGASAGFLNYVFLKLLIWVGLALLIGSVRREIFFGALVMVGAVESVIGFFQFASNRSLGLGWLGESILRPDISEVAKVYLNPGLLIRAYGTMLHPNILAAFLILSLLATYYFFEIYNKNNNFLKFLTTAAIFILWLGLIVTFSRVAWLIAIMATFLYLKKHWSKDLLLVIFLSLVVWVGVLNWAVAPRILGLTFNNFAVQNRLNDFDRAIDLIQERPFWGHGLTLTMGEYPIHNLYLLVVTEIGLLGLAAYLIFIGSFFINNDSRHHYLVGLLMLGSLLMYGLFDHFLWTLRPGLAMFWLVVGFLFYNKEDYEN